MKLCSRDVRRLGPSPSRRPTCVRLGARGLGPRAAPLFARAFFSCAQAPISDRQPLCACIFARLCWLSLPLANFLSLFLPSSSTMAGRTQSLASRLRTLLKTYVVIALALGLAADLAGPSPRSPVVLRSAMAAASAAVSPAVSRPACLFARASALARARTWRATSAASCAASAGAERCARRVCTRPAAAPRRDCHAGARRRRGHRGRVAQQCL